MCCDMVSGIMQVLWLFFLSLHASFLSVIGLFVCLFVVSDVACVKCAIVCRFLVFVSWLLFLLCGVVLLSSLRDEYANARRSYYLFI